MAEKRRGLGRGLGALIPNGPTGAGRPVDVFFPGTPSVATEERAEEPAAEPAGGAPGPQVTEDTSVADSIDIPTQADGRSAGAGDLGREEAALDDADRAIADEETADDGTVATSAATNSEVAAPIAASSSAIDQARSATEPPSTTDAATEFPATEASGQDAAGTVEGTGLMAVPGAYFAEVPVDQVRPNPRQPRTVFDEDSLEELVGSIQEVGVLQPVVVRPTGEPDGPKYELIMGERRWRATSAAGLETIPAIIRETEDHDLLRDALLENLHRSQLNPLEEAAAYQQLLDDFGCTHDELAQRIHRSRPQISNTLRLLRLPPLVQRRVAAGVLSAGHARALLGLPDAAAMERLAQRIVAEGLSVRATEEIVALGGDVAKPAPRAPRPGDRNAALDELAGRLSDRFDTRVKIALGKRKGRLTVEFASVQDLNRILEAMSPDDPGLLR